MFRPLSVFIGFRYTRAKKRNHFISFISLMSMLGIALGVIVLITVLSVMNGFDVEMKKRVFSLWPAISVTSISGKVTNWQKLETTLQENNEIVATAPYITGEVLLTNSGGVQPVMMTGIDPSAEKNLSELYQKMIQGSLDSLQPKRFNIILGEELASRLDVMVGEKIMVVTPQVSISPAGVMPRFKRFTVSGIFRAGSGFGFDMGMAFINMEDAQKLFQLGDAVTGIHAKIKDIYAAPLLSSELTKTLTPTARIMNWTNQFGDFFHAVKLEKTMMFFILLLIIAVAVFNLVCTLVMVVNDKASDIAILRTLGATPKMIMAIFIVQGAVIGITGTILGIMGGVALALNVTSIVNWIQHVFHVQFLSSSVYIVDYLPSQLEWFDVFRITLSALLLSLVATIYPAWRASRTQPVEALRYE